MIKRAWWWGAIALVALVVITSYLLLEETIPDCREPAVSRDVQVIHPQRIVIRPWLGQHHVYAVYTIPGGNRARLSFMQIPGHQRFCTRGFVATQSTDGVILPPRSYILKAYLNTRVALWYMVQGLGDELSQPSHWVTLYSQEADAGG